MGKYTIEERPARRWLLSGLLVVAAIVVVGVLLSRSTPPPPGVPAPIQIQSAPWRAGAEVELTLHTVPPRAGESISLTLLSPGTEQPQVADLTPECFGLAGVQLLWLPPNIGSQRSR